MHSTRDETAKWRLQTRGVTDFWFTGKEALSYFKHNEVIHRYGRWGV